MTETERLRDVGRSVADLVLTTARLALLVGSSCKHATLLTNHIEVVL